MLDPSVLPGSLNTVLLLSFWVFWLVVRVVFIIAALRVAEPLFVFIYCTSLER